MPMGSPWLAIDGTTHPAARARSVRRDWERYLDRGDAPSVRRPIADSWRRSHAAGIDPTGSRPGASDQAVAEAAALWAAHPLAAMVPLIRECLIGMDDVHLLVVSDHEGRLLWIDGDPRLRLAAADSMNFAEGAYWGEADAGTNAIGTALAADHAVQVFAAEHFAEVVQPWTCSAAPVHDPATGSLLGVIDLTSRLSAVHPHALSVATSVVAAVEAELRCVQHERDARLRARHLGRLTSRPGPAALVDRAGRLLAAHPAGGLGAERLPSPLIAGEATLASGRRIEVEPVAAEAYVVRVAARPQTRPASVGTLRLAFLGRDRAEAVVGDRRLELSRRHSEVLALLCLHPAGLSCEQLGAALYGEVVVPSSVRGEVSRLRRLLGRWIDTDPYRLTPGVVSDLAEVQAHLRAGAVAAAAAAYPDALLPRSLAPGVVEERETLDHWVRHAVLSSDDDACRLTFVESAAGHDDLAAWKSVLAALPFDDPRRSRAAAEVGRLRASREALG
jgi:GAF domain